jgi:hypothetical protein
MAATKHKLRTRRVLRLGETCRAKVDGWICGDVWRYHCYKGRKMVRMQCVVHGHIEHLDAGKLLASVRRLWKGLKPRKRNKLRKLMAVAA